MSYYYNYFLGYSLNGKIYPLGPCDMNGKIVPIISRSAGFASSLYKKFLRINNSQVTDELRAVFEYKDWDGKPRLDVKYHSLNDLPDDFIKKGYFLIEDVQEYERNSDNFDGFYDTLSPTVYAARLNQELHFGKPSAQTDIEGELYTPHAVADYMFYTYPDFYSCEYEVFLIKTISQMFDFSIPEGADIIALETEG